MKYPFQNITMLLSDKRKCSSILPIRQRKITNYWIK